MTYLIYVLFTVSGFIGLIYECLWARYLKLFLGHSSYGQVLTLAVYMGGLGLGSFLAGKYAKQLRNPFYLYAAIELLVGVGALLYHRAYVFSTVLFYNSPAVPSLPEVVVNAIKVAIPVLTTGPPAILLGMTFPTIAIGIMRMTHDAGRASLPWLYFTNSLGAAAGIVVTSYFLVASYGLPGSLLVAGTGNILIAVGFYVIARGADSALAPEAVSSGLSGSLAADTCPPDISMKSFVLAWLAVSFLTGFSSFLYEIGWIRLLSLLLGSSTHSFDIMVSAFILGLAVGGFYSKRLIEKTKNIIGLVAAVQILMGFFALMSIYLYKPIFTLMNVSNQVFQRTEPAYYVFSVFKYLLCLLLMFPTSFFAGITLPVITFYLANRTENEKYTGTIYGWNTLGAISGAALGGLLVLPLLQLKYTIAAGAIIDLAIGLFLLTYFRMRGRTVLVAYCFSLVAIAPALVMQFNPSILTAGTFRHVSQLAPGNFPVVVRDGKTATISVHDMQTHMTIRTNGKPDGSVAYDKEGKSQSDNATQAALAFFPMAMRDSPYRAAIIGFGTGMTAHHILSDEMLQSLDVIEIEEEVYNLARQFMPHNRRAYEDSRVRVVFQDAKTYFCASNRKYDVIISEPSNPWVSGVANLFSIEFYDHLSRFLTDDGLLVQWMHLYELNTDLLLSFVKAIDEVFPYAKIYEVPNCPNDILILASRKEFGPKGRKRLTWDKGIRQALDDMGVDAQFFGDHNYLVSTKTLSPILGDVNPNSVFFPIMDSGAEKAFYLEQTADLFLIFRLALCHYQSLSERETFPAILDSLVSFKAKQRNPAENEAVWEQTLLSAKSEAGWREAEVRFHQLIVDAGLLKDWAENGIVSLFRKHASAETCPRPIQLKFRFLDYAALNKTDEIVQTMKTLVAEVNDQQMSSFLIRSLAVCALKHGQMDLYREILHKYVALNPTLDPREKRLLFGLIGMLPAEALRQPERPQAPPGPKDGAASPP
jgi:spermidine synthase